MFWSFNELGVTMGNKRIAHNHAYWDGRCFRREKRSRLVSAALPLREQCELVRCPIGPTGRHGGGLAIVRGESREHFVCVVRIRHVSVTVEFYAESFHVRNVNGAKQRFDMS